MEKSKSWLKFDDIVKFKSSEEFILLEQYYNRAKMAGLFDGVGKNIHIKFLANLFNKNNPYTNNDEPLKRFLGLLSIKADTLGLNCDSFKEVYLNNQELENIEVSVGLSLGSKSTVGLSLGPKSIDITFRFTIDNQKYVIILEANEFIGEFTGYSYKGKLIDQTELYRTLVEDQHEYQDCKKYYVFLSPVENPEISDSQNWIIITYQNLVDYVLSPCIAISSMSNISSMINEYIKNDFNFINKTGLGYFRLAIAPEEIRLVESLWKKYEPTLKAIWDIATNIQNDNFNDLLEIENIVSIFCENNKENLTFLHETLYKLNYIEEEQLVALNYER